MFAKQRDMWKTFDSERRMFEKLYPEILEMKAKLDMANIDCSKIMYVPEWHLRFDIPRVLDATKTMNIGMIWGMQVGFYIGNPE